MRKHGATSSIVHWVEPLGSSVRLFSGAFTFEAFKNLSWREFTSYCRWMGQKGFHLVAVSAVFISIALTIQTVVELQKYNAEDLSGAVISIGLLRELGPLTVSLAWCARVAALLSEEARNYRYKNSARNFAADFVLPRYLAALTMSVPLGGYGLAIGFITGALFAPLIGVNSTNDFLESARTGIQDKDLVVYFIKLIFVNPTIGVFAGCAAGFAAEDPDAPVAANAVTATFLAGYIANLAVTTVAYLR